MSFNRLTPEQWEKRKKYLDLKAMIRAGIRVSREDFLMVKAYDQIGNSWRAQRWTKKPKDNVLSGGMDK